MSAGTLNIPTFRATFQFSLGGKVSHVETFNVPDIFGQVRYEKEKFKNKVLGFLTIINSGAFPNQDLVHEDQVEYGDYLNCALIKLEKLVWTDASDEEFDKLTRLLETSV